LIFIRNNNIINTNNSSKDGDSMENNVTHKQNRKVMVFACILSIISIGLLTLGFFLVSSDKVVLLQSVSNLFNKFSNQTESSSVLIDKIASSNNIGLKSDINIDLDNENINLKLDYLENKESKKSEIILGASIGNEELLDTNLILENDKVNIFIDKITPNYYNTDLEYISIFKEMKSSDYEQIKILLKDVVTDYIKDEDIIKEKIKIIYNEKEKRVNKITYKITNRAVKNVTNDFFNKLKENKDLFENIANYLDKTTSKLETDINKILLSLDYEKEEILYNYTVYYYGFNKIIGYELEELESNMTLEYKIQDKESINFYEGEKHLFSLNITNEKDEYNFDGFIDTEEEKIEFKGTKIGNIISINIDDMKCIITYIIEDNGYKYEYDLDLYQIENEKENKLIEMNMKIEYYFDKEITTNIDKSINIDDITEEDANTIYNNFMNHPLYKLLIEFISNNNENFEINL